MDLPKESNALLDAALGYIQIGWPVLPLRGKVPLTKLGVKEATLNESQVRQWWREWPDANIGVATGHLFFVLDVDIDPENGLSFRLDPVRLKDLLSTALYHRSGILATPCVEAGSLESFLLDVIDTKGRIGITVREEGCSANHHLEAGK